MGSLFTQEVLKERSQSKKKIKHVPPMGTDGDKDERLIELYEQMRGTVLSEASTKIQTRGIGVLVQWGVANWMEAIQDFAPLSKHEAIIQNHCESTTEAIANTMQVDLTNILAEIALKNVREQIRI